MQCIFPQAPTTPERQISNPYYGKAFCEPNQFKVAIDRCDGGYKSCDIAIDIYKDLNRLLENFSESISNWAEASQRKIHLSKEFKTNKAAWLESIQATAKLAQRSDDIAICIKSKVIDRLATFKKSKYEKSLGRPKKIKEFEKSFKKIQQPWVTLLDRINEAKQAYYRSSGQLREAKQRENAIKTDVGSFDDEKEKVKDCVRKYENKTEKHKNEYTKLIDELQRRRVQYETDMFKVLEETDTFERSRLNEFKSIFIALQQATSLENDTRHTEMFQSFQKAIDTHNADEDIKYFNDHYGSEKKATWPVFEPLND